MFIVRIVLLFCLSFFQFLPSVFCYQPADGFNEKITTEEIIPLTNKLPDYWHDYLQKLRYGIVKEETCDVLSRDDIEERFDIMSDSINAVHLYLPLIQLCRTQPLVFFIVHGTWARNNDQYYSLENHEFQQTVQFIRELAERYAQPVEIVSFAWEGQDSIESRQQGGEKLRQLIERYYQPEYGYDGVWAYGHSHGGNIINIASQYVSFETCIYCGTPVVEGTLAMYRPLNIQTLFHMYTSDDGTQKMGSYDRRSWDTFFSDRGNGRVYKPQEDKQLFNMRVQCDGKGMGHLAIQNIIGDMWEIMDLVNDHYYFHSDLDVNVASYREGRRAHAPMISIRRSLLVEDVVMRIQSGDNGQIILSQLRQELDYSEQQSKAFSARYRGRNIHTEGSSFFYFVTNWMEFWQMVCYKVPLLAGRGRKDLSLIEPVVDF